jgi:hypothetical protein
LLKRLWKKASLLCLLALVWVSPTALAQTYRYETSERLVVIGDSHGAFDSYSALLAEVGLVDGKLKWSGGKANLVSLGDFLDRGADSRKIMDLLMRLQKEAAKSGGKVHVLLGNHELMNLTGDLRNVSPQEFLSYQDMEDPKERLAVREYFDQNPEERRDSDFDQLYPPGFFGHRKAFSSEGKYGKWLRTLPFLIVINDKAFTHGGLPRLVAEQGLEGTNRSMAEAISQYDELWAVVSKDIGLVLPATFRQRPRLSEASTLPEAEKFRKLYWKPLFSPEGPLWAREDSMCLPVTVEGTLDASLAALGASQLVVGHTVTFNKHISSRLNGKVIMIDTGMLNSVYTGGIASALVVEKGVNSAFYLGQGGGHKILPLPRQVGSRPASMSDDELEVFLSEAEIVLAEYLGKGITKPKKVILERDGIQLQAIFKDVRFKEQRMGNTIVEFADHWRNEVAAYKLDRLMGLEAVPVTVEREVEGKRGSLQFWVHGLMNWRTVSEAGKAPGNWCEMLPQYQVLKVFDALVHNLDRTQENLAFEKSDWKLILIDHSRAFAARPRILDKIESEYLVVTPAMAKRLEALTEESVLAATRPYLNLSQVRTLMARRDILLRDYLAEVPGSTEPETSGDH